MKLSAPKIITWGISVILAIAGLAAFLGALPIISALAFWLLLAGFVLLAIACLIKGL